MQVRVLFFGVLKDLAGRSSDVLSLPDQATVGDVLGHYAQRLAAKSDLLNSIAISVNQEYARREDRLRAGDEVALLPPVSGGTGVPGGLGSPESDKAFITRERIDSGATLDLIKRPEDGAAVLFEGVVRNHSRGRRTIFLEYEAYEAMALKEIKSLIAAALQKFQVRDVIILHRLGRLEVGETSILIVVASAHRAAAFDACRWLIDTFKRTVPIWKKEHFEDGAVWADGEPFPDELSSKPDASHRAPGLREPGVVSAADGDAVTNPEKLASNQIVRK
jgi:molybdopterin converting factor subunit 1